MGERKRRWGFLRTINILDVAVFCGLAGLGIVGIRSYRLLTTPQAPVRWELDESIEVFCVFPRVNKELAREIRPGILEKDPTGRSVIEVLEIVPASPFPLQANLSSAVQAPIQTSLSVESVMARLRLYGDVREDGRFYCKGRPVVLGGAIEVMTTHSVMRGTVRLGPGKTLFIFVRAQNVPKELVLLLHPGDLVYNQEGVLSGEMISGGVIASASTPNTEMFTLPVATRQKEMLGVTTINTQMIVEVWVKLRCQEYGPSVFFNEQPIKYGKNIVLPSDRYDFAGEVVNISEVLPEEIAAAK